MKVQINVNNAKELVLHPRRPGWRRGQGPGPAPAGAEVRQVRAGQRGHRLAPENIATKRVGNDLHVAFEKSDIATPDLVIEGYYDDPGTAAIVGRAENGVYYNHARKRPRPRGHQRARRHHLRRPGPGRRAVRRAPVDPSPGPVPRGPAHRRPAARRRAAAGGSGGGGNETLPVNHAPTAPNDSRTTPEDNSSAARLPAATPDGDALTYTKGSDPTHGKVTVNPDGSYTYTPDPDYTGTDKFTVVARDGGGTTTSTVTIEVTPPDTPANQPPVAHDDSATTAINTPINNIPVLANDSDPDGDPLTASSMTRPRALSPSTPTAASTSRLPLA